MNDAFLSRSCPSAAGRRAFLAASLGLGATLSLPGRLAWASARLSRATADEEVIPPGLIPRQVTPPNYETPLEELGRPWLTPADRLFIRSHFAIPRVDLSSWRLIVGGRAATTHALSLEDLRAMPQTKVVAVIECSGNGRIYMDPPPNGVLWHHGAVGNAEWEGVSLQRLIDLAGPLRDSRHLVVSCLDEDRTKPAYPDFTRSLPNRRDLMERTILALKLNGAPLPPAHGFPARLVVPGWVGNHWLKWVSRLELSRDEASSVAMRDDYRVPDPPIRPGDPIDPRTMRMIESIQVKSLITFPTAQAKLERGEIRITGVAYAGETPVERVEVQLAGDSQWRTAQLDPQPKQYASPYAWFTWSIPWTFDRAGTHVIRARATDRDGVTQPERAVWNPKGYRWNGIHQVQVTVT